MAKGASGSTTGTSFTSEKVYKAKKINRSEIEEHEHIAKKFEDECIIISPIFVELNDDGTIKKLRDIIRKNGTTF